MRLEHLLSGEPLKDRSRKRLRSRDSFKIDVMTSIGERKRQIKATERFEELRKDLYYSGSLLTGGLAQLARAPALQAGGQRFESVILHNKEHIDMMEAN